MAAQGPTKAVDKYIGARVRMRRIEQGMSQEKLGECLDLTFQQVQKYEKGTNRIGAGRLMHIALLLDVPITYFYEGAPSIEVKGQKQSLRKVNADHDVVVDLLQTPNGVRIAKALKKVSGKPALVRSVVMFLEQIGDNAI